MAFKTVQEFANLFTFETKGDMLTGNYKGSRTWSKEGTDKSYIVHTLIKEDGSEVQFFGAGGLDAQLKKAVKNSKELGQNKCLVQIEYAGLSAEPIKTAYGEKQLHQFDVRLDQ